MSDDQAAVLSAKITAVLPVLGDFLRAEGDFSGQQPRPDWLAWAQRLAWALAEAGQAPPRSPRTRTRCFGQAICDAVTYRIPVGACPDCEAHPAGLCGGRAEDLDRTDAYLALARVPESR